MKKFALLLYNFIFNTVSNRFKKLRNNSKRKRITNSNFSIISQNCIAGTIYDDLGEKFMSPTINLYFNSEDYIKFIENLNYYLSIEVEEVQQTEHPYPVGKIGDVFVYFMHYPAFKDAKAKWDERKKRINYDNLFIIFTNKDDCNAEIMKRFENLSYKNKVIFTSQHCPDIKSTVVIKGYEKSENAGDLLKLSITGKRMYQKSFDVINWVNEGFKGNNENKKFV